MAYPQNVVILLLESPTTKCKIRQSSGKEYLSQIYEDFRWPLLQGAAVTGVLSPCSGKADGKERTPEEEPERVLGLFKLPLMGKLEQVLFHCLRRAPPEFCQDSVLPGRAQSKLCSPPVTGARAHTRESSASALPRELGTPVLRLILISDFSSSGWHSLSVGGSSAMVRGCHRSHRFSWHSIIYHI